MTEVTLLFAVSNSVSGKITIPSSVDGRKMIAINVPEGVFISGETVNWPSAEIKAYPVYTDEPVLPDDENAVDVGLNCTDVTMNHGKSVTFSLNEYTESNQWSFDFTDESILQWRAPYDDSEISFEALEIGSTTLTLSRTDESGVVRYGVCRIIVVEPEVTLNATSESILIRVGKMTGINHNYTTSGLSDEVNHSCTSSDESILSFVNEPNEKWRVNAQKPGDVTDTLTVAFPGITKTLKLPTHVEAPNMQAYIGSMDFEGLVGDRCDIDFWYDTDYGGLSTTHTYPICIISD